MRARTTVIRDLDMQFMRVARQIEIDKRLPYEGRRKETVREEEER